MKWYTDFSEREDTRSVDYTLTFESKRMEYPLIVDLVQKNSTVIDLACGNGSLLELLKKEKNVTAKGVELSSSGVAICQQKGLDVSEGRIDVPLSYKENEFDYAICNVTIQMVMYPETLLKEMK